MNLKNKNSKMRSRPVHRGILLGLISATAALAACGGSDTPAQPMRMQMPTQMPTQAGQATFSALATDIFTPKCGSSCHSAAQASGGLVLAEGQAFGNLVGVDAKNTAAAGMGLKRVVAGSPGTSFLLKKLQSGLDAQFGSQMPKGGTPLDAASIARIQQWIMDGAQNN